MKATVRNIINSSVAAFHSDGLQVFAVLDKNLKSKKHIVLSFDGVKHCSTQFLNAAIGKLYLKYSSKTIEEYLSYNLGIIPHLAEKIKEVKENALNAAEYDRLIERATL